MDDTPKTPLPVVLAPTPVPAVPHGLDGGQLAKLAHEVATDMRDLPEVLKDFKITQEQFNALIEMPGFAKALDIARQEWNSASKTSERIRVKAAASLEVAMPVLAARMMKNEEALPAVVETGKLFAKIAGVGEAAAGGAPGEKFNIVINLGADKTITFEKTIEAHPDPVEALEIHAQPEGASESTPVQPVTKTP